MRIAMTMLVLAVASGLAHADSVDKFFAKAAKQEAATSQPADPQAEIQKLRDQVADLKATIASLRAENERLKKASGASPAAATAPTAGPLEDDNQIVVQAIKDHRVIKGMTLEQARKAWDYPIEPNMESRAVEVGTTQMTVHYRQVVRIIGGAVVKSGSMFSISRKTGIVVGGEN